MSFLNKTKNIQAKSLNSLGFKGACVNYSDVIYAGIIGKIIDDILVNLSNQKTFKQLNYSLDEINVNLLSNFLQQLFHEGRAEGSILFKGEDAVAIIKENESLENFKTLRKKDFLLQVDSNPLRLALVQLSADLSLIINSNSDAIMLEKALIFKLSSLRESASSDSSGGISSQITNSLDKIKKGQNSIIFMDENDDISTLGGSLGQSSKQQYDNVIAQLVLLTGYSDSFFTGQFNHQLGGTLEGQELADSNARKRFFKNYLQGFFSLISTNIQIENKITSLISADKLLELASFDDMVDKRAIYEKLGIPLKSTAKE
jgi:hypothetical protein